MTVAVLAAVLNLALSAWAIWMVISTRNEARRAADAAEAMRRHMVDHIALLTELLAETKLSNENLSEGFARIIAPDDEG